VASLSSETSLGLQTIKEPQLHFKNQTKFSARTKIYRNGQNDEAELATLFVVLVLRALVSKAKSVSERAARITAKLLLVVYVNFPLPTNFGLGRSGRLFSQACCVSESRHIMWGYPLTTYLIIFYALGIPVRAIVNFELIPGSI